ncbi:metallophosphatase [Sphingobacteriaceae bacterium WQ 2009]|uniref:Metallophosphatase n=1 Tax=Rhinopithecimicrobium faecis TaxID=2820698 RepID=A0A8T4HD19_9SPHI|nr:metallophosphatase [Sphingobacteriaceae bacterium WQ 2009]
MEELKSLTRRNFIKKTAAFSALAAFSGSPLTALAARESIKLTILHTNDVHSRIEPFPMDGGRYQGLAGVARRSTLINQIRAQEEHVLLVDAGDMFQGTPYFNLFEGKLELDLMSKLGYEAGTFGNHEFDNGLTGLAKHLSHANFPFLTSNYDFTGTLLAGKTKEYTIIRKGGLKIGLFGLGIDINGLVDPNSFKGMKYLDPLPIANRLAKELKEKHRCDLVICLSHLGYSYKDDKISDLVLAAKSAHIDFIIGGHTHTFLPEPTKVVNLQGKDTYVNQVGFGGINLGRIDITFDPKSGKKQIMASTHEINNSIEATKLA